MISISVLISSDKPDVTDLKVISPNYIDFLRFSLTMNLAMTILFIYYSMISLTPTLPVNGFYRQQSHDCLV